MIAIVDYGLGNVQAFKDVYNRLNVPVLIARSSKDLVDVTKLILPGVGSFDYAITKLDESGMRKNIEDLVIDKKIPILGICLGLQLLATDSVEGGYVKGLDFFKANVLKFNTINMKVPHIGFNQINFKKETRLFENINNNSDFYFVHSYRIEKTVEKLYSDCIYGEKFISSIEKDNIAAVQFHPELSQKNGLKLLENFLHKF